MLKKMLVAGLLFTAACTPAQNQGKTPETVRGQLNRCMFDRTYDLKSEGKIAGADKWTLANEILSSCKRKLRIAGKDISDTQSLNIIVSLIDSIK